MGNCIRCILLMLLSSIIFMLSSQLDLLFPICSSTTNNNVCNSIIELLLESTASRYCNIDHIQRIFSFYFLSLVTYNDSQIKDKCIRRIVQVKYIFTLSNLLFYINRPNFEVIFLLLLS